MVKKVFDPQMDQRAEKLIEELSERYPRAAANIRSVWMTSLAEKRFEELLLCRENQDRIGFDLEAFRLIAEIQTIHNEQFNNSRMRTHKDLIVEREKSDAWYITKQRG